jgi:hypothetical protein
VRYCGIYVACGVCVLERIVILEAARDVMDFSVIVKLIFKREGDVGLKGVQGQLVTRGHQALESFNTPRGILTR